MYLTTEGIFGIPISVSATFMVLFILFGAFVARSGLMLVPYLVDPNTDTAMFESADIVAYLEETYLREPKVL